MSIDKPDRRWWQHKDQARTHQGLWQAYTAARSADRERPERYRALRNYYRQGVGTWEVGSPKAGKITVSRQNRLASACQTAATKIIAHRPDPQVLTSGGSTKLQRQSKQLSMWVGAATKDISGHACVEKAAKEAILCGTGALRVFQRKGKPATEIVYCDHVFVDPLEAHEDAVLTYYWERYVDRSVLLSMYPKMAKHIAKASTRASSDGEGSSDGTPNGVVGTSDMVLVVQAYRVATSDDPEDVGRFCIATEHGLLSDEKYETEDAPFIFIRWDKDPRGFWGIGVGETVAGMQDQLDEHSETVDESLAGMPPAIFAMKGAVKVKQIDDSLLRIYEVDDPNAIKLWAPGGAAVAGHAEREQQLEQRIYELPGISSMEAGAQKPAGLNSGRAQLVHQDIKSSRLLDPSREVEDAYTEFFRRIILVGDEILDSGGDASKLRYLAGKGKELEELNYSDVRLRDTLYRVQVFPVSKLPNEPAGRQERVTELVQAGMLNQDEGLIAMDFPDLESIVEERASMRRHARFLVDKALEGKNAAEWLTPDDDLAEVMRYGQQMRAKAMLSADTDDANEAFEGVADLRELLAQCTALQSQKMEAAAPPQPAAPPMPAPMPGLPGQPGAMPMPAPMPGA